MAGRCGSPLLEMFTQHYYETEEALGFRCRHNANAPPTSGSVSQCVEMPTPAGPLFVELKVTSQPSTLNADHSSFNFRRPFLLGQVDEADTIASTSFFNPQNAVLRQVRYILATIVNFVAGRDDDAIRATQKFHKCSCQDHSNMAAQRSALLSAQDASIMNMRSIATSKRLDCSVPALTAEEARAKATCAAQQSEMNWLKSLDQYHRLSA